MLENIIISKICNILEDLLISITIFTKGFICALKTLCKGKHFTHEKNIDKKVILLGNGPSLKKIDIIKLSRNYDMACVNWFACNNPDFFVIRPKYYFLIDPAFYHKNEKTFYDRKKQVEELTEVMNQVTWKMTIIAPQRNMLETNNRNITYSHISSSVVNGDMCKAYLHHLYDRNLAICGMQNVLCAALHFFIVKGFGKVYLAGVDFDEFKSYVVDERNHVLAVYKHFYGERIVDCTETNYIPLGSFYRWLGFYAKMMKEFHYVSEYATSKNVQIKNLTLNSYIDLFEKTRWETLI